MPSQDRFSCDECHLTYTRKFNLEEHIRIAHSQGDQLTAKCSVCAREFKRLGDCKRHERLQHRSDRKFVCGALPGHDGKGCGKSFARRDALLKHRLGRKKRCTDRVWNQDEADVRGAQGLLGLTQARPDPALQQSLRAPPEAQQTPQNPTHPPSPVFQSTVPLPINSDIPRLSREQNELLESYFQQHQKPTSNVKKGIAESMNVPVDKINNWFQDRRAKARMNELNLIYEGSASSAQILPSSNLSSNEQPVPGAQQQPWFTPIKNPQTVSPLDSSQAAVPMQVHRTLIEEHLTVVEERDELRDEISRLKSILTARGIRVSAKSDVASGLARISQESGPRPRTTPAAAASNMLIDNDTQTPQNMPQIEADWFSNDWLALPLDNLLQGYPASTFTPINGVDMLDILLSSTNAW